MCNFYSNRNHYQRPCFTEINFRALLIFILLFFAIYESSFSINYAAFKQSWEYLRVFIILSCDRLKFLDFVLQISNNFISLIHSQFDFYLTLRSSDPFFSVSPSLIRVAYQLVESSIISWIDYDINLTWNFFGVIKQSFKLREDPHGYVFFFVYFSSLSSIALSTIACSWSGIRVFTTWIKIFEVLPMFTTNSLFGNLSSFISGR